MMAPLYDYIKVKAFLYLRLFILINYSYGQFIAKNFNLLLMHISIGLEEHGFHPMVDLLCLVAMIKLLNYGTDQVKNVFIHSTSIVGNKL